MTGSGAMDASMGTGRSKAAMATREQRASVADLIGYFQIRYIGEYAKNVKQGKGREELPNGQYDPFPPSPHFKDELCCRYYDGSYDHGAYHGAGEFAEEDGSLYTGTWQEGLRQGQGTQVNNRERHEYAGGFVADVYHGSGKCTWVNGSVYDGEWVKGAPNGVGVCVAAA